MVDSFIHVVEQYLTYPVNAKVQDAFSEGLMRVIHEEGLKVLDNPNDYDIRANLDVGGNQCVECLDWAGGSAGLVFPPHGVRANGAVRPGSCTNIGDSLAGCHDLYV